MADRKIGVGVIGVQPGRSWAAIAHIPALQALPEYELVALSTTRIESAKAAGEAFGVANCYADNQSLVADPAVDLVAVTVKVPHHAELVEMALAAGKQVYCEWPLGNGLDEAIRLADLARAARIRCAVGLQARSSPVVSYVRDLVRDGFVGDVLSTTLIGSGMVWGAYTDNPNAYTNNKANGATMLTVPIGHTLDALCSCLGEIRDVSATMANRRTTTLNADTGETLPLTAEDQVAFSGTLDSGAVIAAHYRGGMLRGTGLLWEITGSTGELQVRSFGGHAQIFDLELFGASGDAPALEPMVVPAHYRTAPAELAGPAVNVAQAYQRFAADLRDGTRTCPDFDDAVQRHRMIAAIERSAANGTKENVR